MPLDGLFGPKFDLLQASLGRASQRQGLLMGNLANANVPGYGRKDMDFHVQLDEALGASFSQGRGGGAIRVDGSTVDPEREVAAIAETESRYDALTELTQRGFQNLKTAIREGR